jgi:type I restriction enzyme S subunit
MSFPRYPEYKDSGVEWLGDVPRHWDVWKVSHAFAQIGSGTTPKTDNREYYDGGDIPWVNTGDLNDGELDECEKRITALAVVDHSSLKTYPAGSLLIAMYGATIGRLAILNFAATVNQACCVFAGKSEIASKFMFYWFLGLRQQIISLATGGGQPNISQDILRSLRVASPSFPEQSQIAAFLDRETAKIDALVAEQRQLMALLKEKRQAVISHAVTRGLNPHAPLKPSGIEWLGEVPEHWETRTIAKASTKITNGFVGPTRDILVEAGTPYIQATHIKNGRINFDDGYFVQPDWSAAHSKSILCEGDVLIVQTGAGTGDVGLVSENEVGYNCHALIIVAPDKSLLHGTYLSAVLQSTYGQEKLTSIETGAMHPHLNCGEVKFVAIPLPPLAEQLSIVSYINKSADQFDTLTTEAQRAIDLLQERRTALISAAITGQIDVRGAA